MYIKCTLWQYFTPSPPVNSNRECEAGASVCPQISRGFSKGRSRLHFLSYYPQQYFGKLKQHITGVTDMDLMEFSEKRKMGREEAAQLLHKLADSLARHNGVDFTQKGVKVNIKVPDEVTVEFEVEVESDESSIEVEISW
jgi:amphi-Trp domain-containing protein